MKKTRGAIDAIATQMSGLFRCFKFDAFVIAKQVRYRESVKLEVTANLNYTKVHVVSTCMTRSLGCFDRQFFTSHTCKLRLIILWGRGDILQTMM